MRILYNIENEETKITSNGILMILSGKILNKCINNSPVAQSSKIRGPETINFVFKYIAKITVIQYKLPEIIYT